MLLTTTTATRSDARSAMYVNTFLSSAKEKTLIPEDHIPPFKSRDRKQYPVIKSSPQTQPTIPTSTGGTWTCHQATMIQTLADTETGTETQPYV